MYDISSDQEIYLSCVSFLISWLLYQYQGGESIQYISFLHVAGTALLLYHILSKCNIRWHWLLVGAFWRVYLLTIYAIISTLSIFILSMNSTMVYIVLNIGFFVVIFTLLIIYFLPIPPPANLHGNYEFVGTTCFNIKGNREMTIQVWFPTNSTVVKKSTKSLLWTSGYPTEEYVELYKLLESLGKLNKFPKLAAQHLLLARTNTSWIEDIVLPKHLEHEKIPIVIMSHGLYGWRQVSHSTCEMLASQGFIVFATDHTPDATISRPYRKVDESEMFNHFEEDGLSGKPFRDFYHNGMNRRANDIIEIMDYICGKFSEIHQVDTSNIFLFGHSYGGGTAALVASRDIRVKACVLLDSWMYPMPDVDRQKGCSCPLLILSSEKWIAGLWQMPFRKDFFENSQRAALDHRLHFNFVVRGTDHQNFCDVYRLVGRELLTKPAGIGKDVNPYVIGELLDFLIVDFFSAVLNAKTTTNLYSERDEIDDQNSSKLFHIIKSFDAKFPPLLSRGNIEYLQSYLLDADSFPGDPLYWNKANNIK